MNYSLHHEIQCIFICPKSTHLKLDQIFRKVQQQTSYKLHQKHYGMHFYNLPFLMWQKLICFSVILVKHEVVRFRTNKNTLYFMTEGVCFARFKLLNLTTAWACRKTPIRLHTLFQERILLLFQKGKRGRGGLLACAPSLLYRRAPSDVPSLLCRRGPP